MASQRNEGNHSALNVLALYREICKGTFIIHFGQVMRRPMIKPWHGLNYRSINVDVRKYAALNDIFIDNPFNVWHIIGYLKPPF